MEHPDDTLGALLRTDVTGCPSLQLHELDGSWHLGGCGHPPAAGSSADRPTLAVLLGLESGLCPWAELPEGFRQAAVLLSDHRNLGQLQTTGTTRLGADDAASWARAVMTRRRVFDQLAARLQRWVDDWAPGSVVLGNGSALFTLAATGEEPLSNDADDARCCPRCDRLLRLLAELLAGVHAREQSDWFAVVRSERSREILTAVTADHRVVCMALELYLPHTDHSLDADIADAVVAAFTVARRGSRVALRLPFGLAGFVAIHRNAGGFSEVDRDGSVADDVLETALVLWEPDNAGSYRRWPAAVKAARLLH